MQGNERKKRNNYLLAQPGMGQAVKDGKPILPQHYHPPRS